MAFFTIGPATAVYLFGFTPFLHSMETHPHALAGLGYVSILANVGTGIALMLFNKLIHLTSAIFASSVTYFIPIIALLWGITDGERFKPGFVFFVALVIVGVLLVNTTTVSIQKLFSKKEKLSKTEQ